MPRLSFSAAEFSHIVNAYLKFCSDTVRFAEVHNVIVILAHFKYSFPDQKWKGLMSKKEYQEDFLPCLGERSDWVQKLKGNQTHQSDVFLSNGEYIGLALKLLHRLRASVLEIQVSPTQAASSSAADSEQLVPISVEQMVSVDLKSTEDCGALLLSAILLKQEPEMLPDSLRIRKKSAEEIDHENQLIELGKRVESMAIPYWLLFRFLKVLKGYFQATRQEPVAMRAARLFSASRSSVFNATRCNAEYLKMRLQALLDLPSEKQNTQLIFIEVLAALVVLEVARHCLDAKERPGRYSSDLAKEWLDLCLPYFSVDFLRNVAAFLRGNSRYVASYGLAPPPSMLTAFYEQVAAYPELADRLNGHFSALLQTGTANKPTTSWKDLLTPSGLYRRSQFPDCSTAYEALVLKIISVNEGYLSFRSKFSIISLISADSALGLSLAANLCSAQYLKARLEELRKANAQNISQVIVEVMGISMVLTHCRLLINPKAALGEYCESVREVVQKIQPELPISEDPFTTYVKQFFSYCDENREHLLTKGLSPPEDMREGLLELLEHLKQRVGLQEHAHAMLAAAKKPDDVSFIQRLSTDAAASSAHRP